MEPLPQQLTRRDFLKLSALIGVGTAVGKLPIPTLANEPGRIPVPTSTSQPTEGGSVADLMPSSLTAGVTQSGDLNVNVEVCNGGNAPAGESSVAVKYNGTFLEPHLSVPGLNPDQCSLVSHDFLPQGSHITVFEEGTPGHCSFVEATVDCTNVVPEKNEDNNSLSARVKNLLQIWRRIHLPFIVNND